MKDAASIPINQLVFEIPEAERERLAKTGETIKIRQGDETISLFFITPDTYSTCPSAANLTLFQCRGTDNTLWSGSTPKFSGSELDALLQALIDAPTSWEGYCNRTMAQEFIFPTSTRLTGRHDSDGDDVPDFVWSQGPAYDFSGKRQTATIPMVGYAGRPIALTGACDTLGKELAATAAQLEVQIQGMKAQFDANPGAAFISVEFSGPGGRPMSSSVKRENLEATIRLLEERLESTREQIGQVRDQKAKLQS